MVKCFNCGEEIDYDEEVKEDDVILCEYCYYIGNQSYFDSEID